MSLLSLPELKNYIRTVNDWPKPGIFFRDITTLLYNPKAFQSTLHYLEHNLQAYSGLSAIAALDARGFIFGAPLALTLKVPLVLIRKKGKLPGNVLETSYALEYGEGVLEVSTEAKSLVLNKDVVIIDDLLATGGTALAARELIRQLGGNVTSFHFVINLPDLPGEKTLGEVAPVHSLISFAGH